MFVRFMVYNVADFPNFYIQSLFVFMIFKKYPFYPIAA